MNDRDEWRELGGLVLAAQQDDDDDNPGHSFGVSYSYADMQSAYSTAPANHK